MSKYVGQSYQRKEDYRLLTGKSEFVADMRLVNMAEATIIRSTHAHALIKDIDTQKAIKLDGVFAVITAKDIQAEVSQLPPLSEFTLPQNLIDKIQPEIKPCPEDILANEKVVYVGQPVVVVIAENRYIAEDAASLVKIEYESLPVVSNPRDAIKDDATLIHSNLGSNIQASYHLKNGDIEEVFENADYIIEETIKTPRVSANPIETRGVVASFNRREEYLQVWSSTQVTYMVRSYLSQLLNIVENNVRVVAPDVGGGFGAKCAVYPEEIIIPYLSMKLERPIRWVEDRIEHLLSTRHARDQVHDVKVAYSKDGTILAINDSFLLDNGAFNPLVLTCAYNTAAHLRGIYKIPNYQIQGKCVLTNKAPNIAYRGAGRPEAVYVMDRIIYFIAESLNMDPVDVMLKNMIKAEDMPYDQEMIYRDGVEVVYDTGNYIEGLNKTLDICDYTNFRAEQVEHKKNNKYIGIGISSYVEGTGIGPYEGAIVRLDGSGHITCSVGSVPHGQSHQTTFSQICADEFGVSPDDVTVRGGDTSIIPFGVGTFASRSAVAAGNAVHIAAKQLSEKLLTIAGHILNASVENLSMKDGKVFIKVNPAQSITFRELARAAKPSLNSKLPEGMEPGVEATHYFVPPTVTYSSGFHAAIVEVDKETGFVDILKYAVVHDCGKVINPLIVDGQVQGGVAQGIGAALYEEIVYDDNGQLLSGTYMDYLLPTAMEVPVVDMGHQEYLSTRNPLGIKGVGEAGTISPPAAIANAVSDALKPLMIKITDLPISPNKLCRLISEAEVKY